jgi:hypothetical protein
MKPRASKSNHGAVMIFALALMTAGVFVLAAVLQLAATQGIAGDADWDALDRRVLLLNSRAMAKQHLMFRLFRVPQATDDWPVVFANALGGFSIDPGESPSGNYWGEVTTTNTNVVLNINPFNLMERGGFYREVFEADLVDGTGRSTEWSFALRTRSPVTAGYSVTQHRPGNNALTDYAEPPYIDMSGTNEQFFGYYGMPRSPMSSVTNVSSSGSGETSGFRGYLDVPYGFYTNKLEFADVAYVVRSAATDPNTGVVTVLEYAAEVDLRATNTASVMNPGVWYYDVPATTNLAGLNVAPITTVKLSGAGFFADDVNVPLHLIWTNTNSVTGKILLLEGSENYRPVYLYGSAAGSSAYFDVASTNASYWRLGITMSRCRIQFQTPGLAIKGGLRTDAEITAQAMPTFEADLNPGGLDAIADRMMWLENYRAQQ